MFWKSLLLIFFFFYYRPKKQEIGKYVSLKSKGLEKVFWFKSEECFTYAFMCYHRGRNKCHVTFEIITERNVFEFKCFFLGNKKTYFWASRGNEYLLNVSELLWEDKTSLMTSDIIVRQKNKQNKTNFLLNFKTIVQKKKVYFWLSYASRAQKRCIWHLTEEIIDQRQFWSYTLSAGQVECKVESVTLSKGTLTIFSYLF